MKKVAIVYWSGSGNTEAMANAVKAGVESAGAQADLFSVSDFNADAVADYDGVALGCPAMGAETLEESEFQPVYDEMKPSFDGKPVALFGSYGWGTGEWMEAWVQDAEEAGAKVFEKGLIINEAPDDDGIAECESFGKRFAESE